MERSAEEDVDTDPSIPICLEELEAEGNVLKLIREP